MSGIGLKAGLGSCLYEGGEEVQILGVQFISGPKVILRPSFTMTLDSVELVKPSEYTVEA